MQADTRLAWQASGKAPSPWTSGCSAEGYLGEQAGGQDARATGVQFSLWLPLPVDCVGESTAPGVSVPTDVAGSESKDICGFALRT